MSIVHPGRSLETLLHFHVSFLNLCVWFKPRYRRLGRKQTPPCPGWTGVTAKPMPASRAAGGASCRDPPSAAGTLGRQHADGRAALGAQLASRFARPPFTLKMSQSFLQTGPLWQAGSSGARAGEAGVPGPASGAQAPGLHALRARPCCLRLLCCCDSPSRAKEARADEVPGERPAANGQVGRCGAELLLLPRQRRPAKLRKGNPKFAVSENKFQGDCFLLTCLT